MNTPFFPSLRPILAPMGARPRHTARACHQATLAQIEQTLAPALPAELLRRPAAGHHSRQRRFPLARTFWCWIWQIFQANTSCREVVRQVQALLALLQNSSLDESTSAYCQARGKLSLPLLQKAFAASGRSAEKLAPSNRLLQGRPVKIADGSSVRLQDTHKNRAAFPAAPNQFGGPSFPLLRILGLFSLASGALLAHFTGSLKTAELRLLMSLEEHFQSGDILVADRAYGQYVLIYWLNTLGVDLLARLNARSRRVDFRMASKRLGPKDGLFVWHKPQIPSKLLSPEQWAQVPETITVRVLHARIQRPGFRTRELTIVTTLLDPQLYPAEEVFETYFKRWRLEMCLDDLKTTLGMEMLGCKSPGLVQKELLIYLTAHNFIRWIIAQAAQAGKVDSERLSFKGTLDAFRQWTLALVQVRGPGKPGKQKWLWRELLQTLAADLVPHRPERQEPRAVKKRSKYPRLNKPRHSYVERWSRNKRRRAARAKKHQPLT
jgi:Transposase DDE domain